MTVKHAVIAGTLVALLMAVMVAYRYVRAGTRYPIDNRREVEEAIASNPALKFEKHAFEKIIDAFSTGTLVAKDGIIQLPPKQALLTRCGCVYVTLDPTVARAFLFVVWQGKGSNLEGYAYCPSGGSVVAGRDYPRSMELLTPVISTDGEAAAKIEVAAEKMDSPGWYFVFRDLD